MPTKQRVTRSSVKVCASPVAPLARLQRITPIATRSHREKRSPSQPKTGAKTM
jgi:hypothetical protein